MNWLFIDSSTDLLFNEADQAHFDAFFADFVCILIPYRLLFRKKESDEWFYALYVHAFYAFV